MSLRSRIRELEQSVPEMPKAPVMPGATVLEIAIALVKGQVRFEDLPLEDPRRIEAAGLIAAHIARARWRREHPDG